MKSVRSLWDAGDFEKLGAFFFRTPFEKLTADERVVRVGFYAFSGKIDDASESARLSGLNSESRFYLAVGLCRASRYDESQKQIQKLTNDFFGYQARAFFLYFSGRFNQALVEARKAHEFSLKHGFELGRLLALDLLGHALVQTGEISQGFRYLEDARKRALKIGNKSWLQAIDVSLQTYKSQFTLPHEPGRVDLQKFLETVEGLDGYSRTALKLELARQSMLRGRLKEAETVLDSVWPEIHRSQNRRQAILAHLRSAMLQHLRGQKGAALNLVEGALNKCHSEVDRHLKLQALGLKVKISESLGRLSGHEEWVAEVSRLSQENKNYLAARIQTRVHSQHGEDRMGDLLDSWNTKDDLAMFRDAIQVGVYFKMIEAQNKKNRESESVNALILTDDQMVYLNREGVFETQNTLTPLQFKFLKALNQGDWCSKEWLVKNIWGYVYHPLRHDSLVYSTILSLRDSLGEAQQIVQTGTQGYRLNAQVEDLRVSWTKKSTSQTSPAGDFSVFNVRQIKILKLLQTQTFIHLQDCKKLFRGSNITFSRDLSSLVDKGVLVRVGKARATQYCLPQSLHVNGSQPEEAL